MATANENQKRLEALPVFLRPRFRLFLSADLIGSTAAKQQPNFPIQTPERLWENEGMAPPWLSPIANFFGSFREAFIREWRIFRSQTALELGIEIAIDPSFWKANGDELIFVKELDDRREMLGCIHAWMQAIKSIRPQVELSGLDIKATAWTAGFPVTNSELVFQVNPGSQTAPYEDDPRLQQFALLDRWYEGAENQTVLLMDFIGPSLDIGFRLAAHSTSRNFVVSIDIAYFLANTPLPPKSSLKIPPIFYGGKIVLKGVLGGKAYPIFWIDTKAPTPQQAVNPEDRLLGNTKLADISDFCVEFYREHSTQMFEPFIFREDKALYGEFPQNYIEALEHLHTKWEAEKQRYLSETGIETAIGDQSEKLTGVEAMRKEKDIMEAIERQSPKK